MSSNSSTEHFTIVALPEKQVLKKLNNLRNYFYKNDFRFTNKPNTLNAHISLAVGSYSADFADKIKRDLQKILKSFGPFIVSYKEVVAERRPAIPGKCDFENSWVALTFENTRLRELSHMVDNYLISQKKSLTEDYIKEVRKITKSTGHTGTIIADHMNLCNYCKPEKADEARLLISETVDRQFTIDKIALINRDQIVWTLNLKV